MKVVYITSPSFFDADLSLINELRKMVDLTVLIDLPSFALKTTALALDRQPKNAGIYPVSALKGFESYLEYLGENCYIINRPKAKRFSVETIRINSRLRHFLTRLNPDIIHFNNPVTQFAGSVLRFKTNKVMTIHDPIPHLGEAKGNLSIRDWNMKYVKHYVLLNNFQKESFISNYNLSPNQVSNSFLGAFDFYKQYKVNPEKNDGFNLLFFGRLTAYKGVDLLLRVFSELKQSHPKLTLTIAGKGEMDFSTKSAEGVNVLNRYIPTEELAKLINASDLVVCPYIEGTQSGVIMTSFAFSKPVLATKVGGFHEMISDNRTGFLVEPNNAEALKFKLAELIENKELLHQVSKNIASEYGDNGEKSWKKSVTGLLNIYENIIKQNGN